MKWAKVRGGLFITAAVLLLMMIFKDRSPFGKKNSSFSSEPKTEITKIEFSSGGKRLYLEREENRWMINGKVEARKSGVLYIEKVLREMKIKSPVSDELFQKEVTDREVIPVTVKVFERRKMLKSFIVYKTYSNKYGNIMKLRERSKPFIVSVPGYEGEIGSAFTLNELFWQPYTVFNLLPSEIESVDFENFSDTAMSFSIFTDRHHYTLSNRNRVLKDPDSTLVLRYLSYFTWIPFEEWAFNIGEKEYKRIVSQQPLYRISVSTFSGTITILTLWEKITGENGKGDSDRLLGKTQMRDELFVLRYFDVDPLIKKRSYFFQE